MAKKVAQKDRARKVEMGPGNFVSQLFFFWIFWLIPILRRKGDFKCLNLTLRKTEKTDYNDTILDKAWKKELLLAAQKKRYFIFHSFINLIGCRRVVHLNNESQLNKKTFLKLIWNL
jgi:hypothetical protein